MNTTHQEPGQEAIDMTAIDHADVLLPRLEALARRLRMRRVMRGLALAAVVLAGFAAVLAALVLQALEPAPGDWSTPLRWSTPVGAVERRLSVPVLLRWATHPLAARLLDGREWHTRTGTWRLHVGAGGEIRGDCQPCVLQLAALGPGPLHIAQASWQLKRASPEHWQGSLSLGEAGHTLNLAWRAQLRSDGLEIRAELPPVPLADALALFAETVPEARRARVDGVLALRLDARWGPQGLHLVSLAPRLQPFAAKAGMRVGYHNHSRISPDQIATPDDLATAMKAGPNICATLDVGHFTAANFDAIAFLDAHHDRIVSMHLKDRKRDQGATLPFGEGDAPIAAVLTRLRDRKWDIPAHIEYEYRGTGTIEDMTDLLAFCRRTLETR